MITKTAEEIEIIRWNCAIVNQAIAESVKLIAEGKTTLDLDTCIETFIRDNGAVPSFKGYRQYPFASCISVNDAVVHGFPNAIPLRAGDVISVDAGAFKNGFHSDSAYTVILGASTDSVYQLLKIAKESLYKGIDNAIVGNKLGDIGWAIQEHTEKKYGYGVVRELVGHGLGKNLHEEPNVPNYGKKGKGTVLPKNLVIAIEPMINLGTEVVFVDRKDNWTVRTRDKNISVHFEHIVAVGDKTPDILSDFRCIEKAILKNPNLWNES